jgi:hypothetical protein
MDVSQKEQLHKTPVCPNCILPMRYAASEVDQQYDNLRHVMFVCSCGLASDQVVATGSSPT